MQTFPNKQADAKVVNMYNVNYDNILLSHQYIM